MVVVVIVDKVIFQIREDRDVKTSSTCQQNTAFILQKLIEQGKSVSIYRYIEERGKQYCDV